MNKIPRPVLKVLGASCWMTDEHNLRGYETTLSSHKPLDARDGHTAAYIYRPGDGCSDGRFNYLDIKVLASVIPAGMLVDDGGCLRTNQHFSHSLGQFMANCQHQWDLHLKRMAAIEGTASARVIRHDKAQ